MIATNSFFSKLETIILNLCVLAVCGVLLGAFWIQFYEGEYPCPLCVLQRMGMMLATVGPMLIIIHGRHRPLAWGSVGGIGYGTAIIGAMLGMCISARQVLLHIIPPDPGYGSPVFGMHLYTWALVVFMAVIAVCGLMLIFGGSLSSSSGEPSEHRHGWKSMAWYSKFTFFVLGIIIIVNIFSTLAEAGFNLYLPDNPDSYLLFEQADEVAKKTTS